MFINSGKDRQRRLLLSAVENVENENDAYGGGQAAAELVHAGV
jgi:hypothetical protein